MYNKTASLLEKKLATKLDEIYTALYDNTENISSLGILNGLSGVTLFFFEYAKYKDDNEAYEKGLSLVSGCFDVINSGYDISTYCSGIAGWGWLMEHLKERDLVDFDNDQMLNDLDPAFEEKLHSDFDRQYYDFLHGGLGYAFFFLKRYRNTKSPLLKSFYKEQLSYTLTQLERQAESENGKTKWITDIGSKKMDNVYDFGLAHGIPSIINFLCRLSEIDEFKIRAIPLIRNAAAYLLSHKNTNGETSLFPDLIPSKDITINRNSRMAWCYGDLGIGLTLARAAKALGDTHIHAEAIATLEHAAKRRSPEETSIKDSGLCHGAFGLALMFHKMHQQTQIPILKDACFYWCEKGLKMAFHDDGWAGYKKWVGGKGIWENETSLLEGIAGVGLAIISILDASENNWDECLMIS